MSGIVLNPLGQPQPPSDIVRRLRQVHPALGLKFYQPGVGASAWALTWRWPDADPRREYIRRGQMAADADYDILTWLPLDCPVDQAAGYVERALAHHPREDIKSLVSRVHHYNAEAAVDANWREVETAVMTTAESLGKKATPRSVVPRDITTVAPAAAAAVTPNGTDAA
jgi:hypothetical protein